MSADDLTRRIFISACAFTRTTELLSHRLGTAFFLPKLFVLRYSHMGGLDRELFSRQLNEVRSFSDEGWCGRWDAIADDYAVRADRALDRLNVGSRISIQELLTAEDRALSEDEAAALRDALEPGAVMFADHGPQPSEAALDQLVREHAERDEDGQRRLGDAMRALDALVKAITYFQVSAFPGMSPARMRAYHHSRRLSDILAAGLGATLGREVERVSIPIDGGVVNAYAMIPSNATPGPAVILTNGLEGTVQELLIPLLRYRNTDLGVLIMEMPGSYAYEQRMSLASERIYDRVIDHLVADPRVDGERIGIFGVSFGGYWAARLAATNRRLRCAVACGAPTHNTFQAGGVLGKPQIILETMRHITGARNPLELSRKLRALSLRGRYQDIEIPLLVINGDNDTLIDTADSVELADGARNATLRLFDDDHCAMNHYSEWLDLTYGWLEQQLSAAAA